MSTEKFDRCRTLVLCFDGTGNLFDSTNTNIVKLFSLLDKCKKDEQLVYYQAGIGTYAAPGILPGFQLGSAKLLDQAIAWYLDAHVKGGYKFLMQNYCEGDRICLFGFSRGAYTARVLAGMLYKVGLLPKDNEEQVNFAYNMFRSRAKDNRELAYGFKLTFSRMVPIEFVGCWDTVASVGMLWPRHLPFTSSNTIIKRFRHALSLDERRANFHPNLWHRHAPHRAAASKDPEQGSHVPKHEKANGDVDDGEARFEQPGELTDVLEVWFAGCHSDVGGGDTLEGEPHSLANVSLRWMVREIIASECGIVFDPDALARLGISLDALSLEARLAAKAAQAEGGSAASGSQANKDGGDHSSIAAQDNVDAADVLTKLHDELKRKPLWWTREIVPLFIRRQDEKGEWHRTLRWNLGRGRQIPISNPNLHASVRQRMNDKGYVPKAVWNEKPNAKWVA